MAKKRRKLPNGTGSIEKVELTPQGKKRVNQYRARLPSYPHTRGWSWLIGIWRIDEVVLPAYAGMILIPSPPCLL